MKYRSALMTEASGSVGGLVASHNRGGTYFRSRTVPVNGNTVYQQTVRSKVRELSTTWTQTLTADQRQGWMDFAAAVLLPDPLGTPRNIGGLAWYCKANVGRMQAGLARIDAAPATQGLAAFTNPTATVAAAGDTISVTFTTGDAWANEVGGAMLVYTSPPQNASINSYSGPYRYAGKIVGAGSPPASPASINLAFDCAAGQKIFYRVVVVTADGRVSDSFRNGAIAA